MSVSIRHWRRLNRIVIWISEMPLVDYLYVDQKRLDSYVEQIGAPVMYDKVPRWKAEIGLAGPKAKVEQKQHARPLTLPEKIERLIDYLEKETLLSQVRPYSWHEDKVAEFVMETCVAMRIEIPLRSGPDSARQSLNLWLSPKPSTPLQDDLLNAQMLWLLEDYGQDDVAYRAGSATTGFSVLNSLVKGMPVPVDRTVLGGKLPAHEQVERKVKSADEAIKSVVEKPVRVLKSLGCKAHRERKINVLYRIRELGPELSNRAVISTFGYPIYIASST